MMLYVLAVSDVKNGKLHDVSLREHIQHLSGTASCRPASLMDVI